MDKLEYWSSPEGLALFSDWMRNRPDAAAEWSDAELLSDTLAGGDTSTEAGEAKLRKDSGRRSKAGGAGASAGKTVSAALASGHAERLDADTSAVASRDSSDRVPGMTRGAATGDDASPLVPQGSMDDVPGVPEVVRRFLDVTDDELGALCRDCPEFLEALRRTRVVADAEVEEALRQKALRGDTSAMLFWLKNRRPDRWRDKPEPLPESRPRVTIVAGGR